MSRADFRFLKTTLGWDQSQGWVSLIRTISSRHKQLIRLQHRWATAFTVVERLHHKLSMSGSQNNETESSATDVLESWANDLKTVLKCDIPAMELTDPESEYIQLAASVIEGLRERTGRSGKHKGLPVDAMKNVEKYVRKRAMDTKQPDIVNGARSLSLGSSEEYLRWGILHDAYLSIDGLKLAKHFARFKSLHLKNHKAEEEQAARLLELQRNILRSYEALRAEVSQLKANLQESGVIGSLVDLIFERTGHDQGSIGAALEEFIGESALETLASNIVDSWQDALDGVLSVKLE